MKKTNDTETILNEAISAFNEHVGDVSAGLYVLGNKQMKVSISAYGARIVHLFVPDKNGLMTDVVIGPGCPKDFQESANPYYGALIGRYANRIANGSCQINGREIKLNINNGPNHLHGGPHGFHSKAWEMKSHTNETITLQYVSAPDEEGFPGELTVTVFVTLHENSLLIRYEATTDATTIINLTHHPFFNLNGCGTGPVLKHTLQIHADHYLPVNPYLIPTGILEPVSGTPFDFRQPVQLQDQIFITDEQLTLGNGYDHNFVLNKTDEHYLSSAASLKGDISGIQMDILTTEPGMQLYTGNFMDGKSRMKYDTTDEKQSALCLETQHFPDSPNHRHFPSVILQPGEVFQSSTEFRFLV